MLSNATHTHIHTRERTNPLYIIGIILLKSKMTTPKKVQNLIITVC